LVISVRLIQKSPRVVECFGAHVLYHLRILSHDEGPGIRLIPRNGNLLSWFFRSCHGEAEGNVRGDAAILEKGRFLSSSLIAQSTRRVNQFLLMSGHEFGHQAI
jgi:hypothetical protein